MTRERRVLNRTPEAHKLPGHVDLTRGRGHATATTGENLRMKSLSKREAAGIYLRSVRTAVQEALTQAQTQIVPHLEAKGREQ